MISALLRYPKVKRREVAQSWANRSNAAQAAARIERGPDNETVYRRALDDARGEVLRHGVTYSADKPHGEAWEIVRSKRGRTNQVDVRTGNKLAKTCGLRTVERGMKRAKL